MLHYLLENVHNHIYIKSIKNLNYNKTKIVLYITVTQSLSGLKAREENIELTNFINEYKKTIMKNLKLK